MAFPSPNGYVQRLHRTPQLLLKVPDPSPNRHCPTGSLDPSSSPQQVHWTPPPSPQQVHWTPPLLLNKFTAPLTFSSTRSLHPSPSPQQVHRTPHLLLNKSPGPLPFSSTSSPDTSPSPQHVHRTPHLLLTTDSSAGSRPAVPGLHLKHGSEEVLGQRGQELDLGVGVQAVQVGALGGQAFVDVGVVALVVRVGRDGEAGG